MKRNVNKGSPVDGTPGMYYTGKFHEDSGQPIVVSWREMVKELKQIAINKMASAMFELDAAVGYVPAGDNQEGTIDAISGILDTLTTELYKGTKDLPDRLSAVIFLHDKIEEIYAIR